MQRSICNFHLQKMKKVLHKEKKMDVSEVEVCDSCCNSFCTICFDLSGYVFEDSPPDSPTKKDSGKDAFYDDDSESDEDRIDYRIEHILGRRTMTAMEWTAVTDNMITREITKGSVLQQPDDEYFDQSKAPVEKFLIKWVHASYLHVSWETEKDLVDLVGKGVKHSIKKYLQREAEGRELFEDLSNGEYFPSSYIQIERVLDVDDKDVVVATIDWENVPLRIAKDFVMEEETVKEVPVEVEVKSDSESDDLLESARNDEQTTPWSFEDSDSGAESPFAELDRKKVQRKTVRRINYTENSEDELELIDLVNDEVDEESNEEAEERKPAKKAPKPKKAKEVKKKPLKKKVVKKVKNQALHGDNCWVTVKWEGLSYSEVSFESLNDIIRFNIDYETQLRSFFKREQAPPKEELQGPRKMTLDHKVLGSTVEAPSFPGGVLRDYQWEGVRWMLFNLLQGRNSILADEMGLGKTIQSSTLLHMLKKHQTNAGPFLVVAPLSTIVNWQREVRAWTNLDAIMYYGSQEDRELIRSYEFNFLDKKKKGYKVEVVITTPETCVATDDKNGGRMKRVLSKIGWDLIIVDEAHKLKNYDSKLSSTLREEFYYRNCVLLTGTPLQNNTEELWTLLNFVGPSDFALKDEFMEKFGDLKSSAQLEELHNLIKPYLLRREKENVEKTVPPKQEMVIEVELTVPQKQYYRAIFEQKTGFLYKASMKDGPSLTNLAMELRKCCNHPYLIKGAPVELAKHFKEDSHMDILIKSSGKMTLLAKLLPKLQKDGHRVLIFSQFRMMLDIIEDYVHNAGFMYERVDGSIVGKKRQAAIDRYTENNKIFVMLLSTKAGGVGINLTAADTVIIYDSDWNPQNDIQAQARAHRIGQTRSVTVYRLLTKKTYEMAMFRAASIKLGLDYAVMHNLNQSTATLQSAHAKMRGSTTALAGISSERADTASALSRRELENLLKHGAYDIFLEEKEGKSETESTMFVEESIEQILERSSVFLHQQNDSEMQCMKTSSFAKASFISAGTADAASEEVAIDDPDFWSKVVGLSVEDQAIAMGAKRKCRQSVDSYKEPSMSIKSIYGDRQSAYVTDSDDNSVDSQGNKRSSKRRKKPEQPEIVPADYTADNLASILTAMVNHGYGEWDSIRRASKLWWNDADIATACTYNVLGCLMYSAVVVDKAATATAKDSTGGSTNAEGDAQIQVAEEATPNADEATTAVTAAAKEDSIKFDLTLAKSLLRRYKVCKLAMAVYLSCATAMSPAASQEDYLLSQVVRSLIEYSNIEQRSTLQMRRHFTSALVALVKATESSEDDEDSSVALSAWMTKVADGFPTSTLGTEIYSLGEETDVGKVQKKISMAKSKLAQLDDLFEARVYSKLAKQMVSAGTDNLAPSSSAEGAMDVDGEDEARLLASPSVNVLKQLTKTSEDEDAADQFWSVEHDHSLLLAAAAYGFPDSKKRYFRIMEEISVKHGIEYSSTVPVSAPSTTSPTDGEQSATTATTAVEGGDGTGAASTSQPVNNGIHEKYTPKFLSTRLRAVGRMLRCTEEDLQAVAKREAQVERAKAQAEKALLAAKNAEKNLRKKNVTQVLKTAQRIGYPRSIYPVLLENLRGALGAESPALASRAEYLLSWESFHTACEVGQMDMETTREVVQQAIAHTNQSPEEATEVSTDDSFLCIEQFSNPFIA